MVPATAKRLERDIPPLRAPYAPPDEAIAAALLASAARPVDAEARIAERLPTWSPNPEQTPYAAEFARFGGFPHCSRDHHETRIRSLRGELRLHMETAQALLHLEKAVVGIEAH